MTDPQDYKARSKKQFSQHAQGYVDSVRHAQGADLQHLVELAAPQPDWQALDIATGGGHTALSIAPHVKSVIATDLTPAMLDKAADHIQSKGATNVTYQVADAEDLPFDDSTFDLVTCRIAPHHFPNPGQFVAECYRVLKAGGRLVVQDHVLPEDEEAARTIDNFERLRDPSHAQAHSQVKWIAMFEAADFTVEHTEQVIKRHEFLAWAERMGCPAETIAHLIKLVNDASPAISEWMQPLHWGTDRATFVNHHILITGRKLA